MARIKDHRIYTHHRREFRRGEPVTIHYEGHDLKAFSEEPVAVALYASGVRVASRSMKFHRPRGVFCLSGRCMSCLARVDGVPNVRTCHLRCRDGMTVRRENALPQADDDLLFTFDFVFPKGMEYHEMATRPAVVNKMMQQLVQRFAGTGDLPDKPVEAQPVVKRRVEVLVIGGGPGGMSAALAAGEAGARVLLVEDAPEPGGHLVGWPREVEDFPDGPSWVDATTARLKATGVEVVTGGECIGRFREGFWAIHKDGYLMLVEAERVIVATGAYDQPPLFAGGDLPNVFSARAMLKLVNRWGICPAVACTIVGTDDAALALADELGQIGVRVVGLVDESPQIRGDGDLAEKIQSQGVPIFSGYRVTRALGRFHLKGLTLQPLGGGETVKAASDLVVVSAPGAPSWELAAQAGAETYYEPLVDGFTVACDPAGRTRIHEVFVTGEMRGAAKIETIIFRGKASGLAAALDLYPNPEHQARLDGLFGD